MEKKGRGRRSRLTGGAVLVVGGWAARLLGRGEKKPGEVGKGLGRGEGLVGPHGQLATKPSPADFFFFSFFS